MGKDERVPVAIACQGGGAQTAFTAGVLERLLEEHTKQGSGVGNTEKQFDIVALSGTSGGAICAAIAWCELLVGDTDESPNGPIRLRRFWTEGYPDGNAAAPYLEAFFKDMQSFWAKGEWPWLRVADRLRVDFGQLIPQQEAFTLMFPFHVSARPRPYYFERFFTLQDSMPAVACTQLYLDTARWMLESVDSVASFFPLADHCRKLALDSISLSPYVRDGKLRREFDVQSAFRDLVARTFASDIEAIARKYTPEESKRWPELLIGAVDVLKTTPCEQGGPPDFEDLTNFRVFRGTKEFGRLPDVLIASTAMPDIMRAVEMDGTAYWDGLFSQNPPLLELPDVHGETNGDQPQCGKSNPEEIWLILINPLTRGDTPKTIDEIADRRNELSGNISLNQELRAIRKMNGATVDRKVGNSTKQRYYRPIDIPNPIQMSPDISGKLKLPSKINRQSHYLEELYHHGHTRAQEFLDNWRQNRAQAPGNSEYSSPSVTLPNVHRIN